MRTGRGLAVVVASIVLGGASAACGGADQTGTSPANADEVTRLRIPRQIVGLTVEPEEFSERSLERVVRPYVDGVAVYSLREGDVLRATLQVTGLNRRARPDDPAFRDQVVEQISTVQPTELVVGGRDVFAAGGAEQNIYVWFEGRGLIVLGVHEGFPFPRTLLRRLIEADLGL